MGLYNHNKIDEIDAKILKALLNEARTTFTEMAKDCGITIAGVRAKFLRLKKMGVINGAIMQVDPYSLGYDYLCDITMKTIPGKEKQAYEYLKTKKYSRILPGHFGKQNLAVSVMLSSINELENILEDIAKCKYVTDVEPLIWSNTRNMDHTENLVIPPLENNKKTEFNIENAVSARKKIKLDESEIEIAKILVDDARTPFRVIGKKLEIPTQTVIRKYQRLRNSVLTKSTITVNLQKIGYSTVARLFIKVANKSEEPQIYSKLLQIPNAIVGIRHLGIYDIRIIIALKNFEDWFEVEEELDKIKGITERDVIFTKAFCKWPLNIFADTITHEDKKTLWVEIKSNQK